ncbi:MAG: alpha/beta fold hydrolase [Alphaproteobacteria bacterium]
MSVSLPLSGPSAEPQSGGKAKSLVVLLHGVGADGNDLFGLVPMLAPYLPDTAFVSPNAPQHCDMAPMGYQWFSLLDRTPSVMEEGIRNTAPTLDEYLDGLMELHNLPADRIALVGFSQGTMMSLYVAPRRKQALAGVVGFSGALLGGDSFAEEVASKPPVRLIHGTADDVVPFGAMQLAEQTLSANGFDVDTHARPGLGHGIDPDGISLAIQFLQAKLS